MKTLPRDVKSLQLVIKNLRDELQKKDQFILDLTESLKLARQVRFGRKSEKGNPNQGELFDEASLPVPEEKESEPEPEINVPAHARKRAGRKPLPKSLPRLEVLHELKDEALNCACGNTLTEIGEERTEQLEIIPQMAYVKVNIRKKYACKAEAGSVKIAALPKQPIPQSIATAGTLAYVIDAKFNYHLPLYRLEQILNRNQIEITRATLGSWLIKSANLLKPLVKILHDIILNYDIAHADETELQVLKEKDPERKAVSKSRMWLFIGGPPEQRSVIYEYHPTRSADVANAFFDGFKGYLHTDCYRGYDALIKKEGVTGVACWAHARRKFYDIVKTAKKKKGVAYTAIKKIAVLYEIESRLKEEKASTETIYKTRQTESKKQLLDFEAWLREYRDKVPPRSLIGKAITYSLNHWAKLIRYIEDGRLEIDNNRAERAIKPFVIGRKNWLFHGNYLGAEAGAVLYSLMETCKAHKIEPYAYFRYVLSEIVNVDTLEALEKLLPFNCDKRKLAQQRRIPSDLIWPAKDKTR